MKYANYYVDYMVYASLMGKSLFVAFGKSSLGFRKIFTPGSLEIERVMALFGHQGDMKYQFHQILKF